MKNASLFPNECFDEQKQTNEFFSEPSWKIVVLWQWISNWLSKMGFICLKKTFPGDFSFLNKTLTIWSFLSEFEQNFFRSLSKRYNFARKKSARLSQVGFTLSKGPAGKAFLLETKSDKKTFSRIEWKFVMFCRTFSADSWKKHHRVQMDLLRKNIYVFPKHNCLQLIFSRWEEILRQKNSTASSKLRFYLSRESSCEEKVCLEKMNSLVIFF